ncbi:hypothetical protein BKA81DRAFT_420104, partial [Phyllosticta paracitricarpa]
GQGELIHQDLFLSFHNHNDLVPVKSLKSTDFCSLPRVSPPSPPLLPSSPKTVQSTKLIIHPRYCPRRLHLSAESLGSLLLGRLSLGLGRGIAGNVDVCIGVDQAGGLLRRRRRRRVAGNVDIGIDVDQAGGLLRRRRRRRVAGNVDVCVDVDEARLLGGRRRRRRRSRRVARVDVGIGRDEAGVPARVVRGATVLDPAGLDGVGRDRRLRARSSNGIASSGSSGSRVRNGAQGQKRHDGVDGTH